LTAKGGGDGVRGSASQRWRKRSAATKGGGGGAGGVAGTRISTGGGPMVEVRV
jgi:hypothetical protein